MWFNQFAIIETILLAHVNRIILKGNPVELVKSFEVSKVKVSNFPHNISFNFFSISIILKPHKTIAGFVPLAIYFSY